MIEEFKAIKGTTRELRNFALLVGPVLAALGGLLLWKGGKHPEVLLIAGALLVFAGLVAPGLLRPLYKAWMTLAVVMGWVMSRVILIVLYYAVVTPLGLGMRLLGKRPLSLGPDKSKQSYWNYRESKSYNKKRHEQQF